MYIAPNSDVFFMHNVPLDNTYIHTILFRSVGEQLAFVRAYQIDTVSAQSYVRLNENRIRVNRIVNDLQKCNYLCFINRSIETSVRYYYAFITDVIYINNSVTEIEFEIDVMQTWLMYVQPNTCFIEREHTLTDNPGDNVLKENVDLGDSFLHSSQNVELIETGSTTISDDVDLRPNMACILTASAPDPQHDPIIPLSPIITNYGVYSNLTLYAFNLDNAADVVKLYNWLNGTNGQQQIDTNKIIAMYQYPAGWAAYAGSAATDGLILNQKRYHVDKPTGAINGYTPVNKKLYTYPYCFLRVSNNQGDYSDLPYENFNDNSVAEFNVSGTLLPIVSFYCAPVNYSGIGTNNEMWDMSISLKNFPVCCWQNDIFKNWWAENQNSFLTSAITGTLGAMTSGAVLGGGAGAIMGAAAGVGQSAAANIAKITDMRNVPNTASNISMSYLISGADRYKYTFYNVTLKPQQLKAIDDYFSMFGYACRQVKRPYRNARPHWTYVKTAGCTLKRIAQNTCIDSETARKICEIYDRGITFWNSAAEVGNYALDNSPYTTPPANPY